MGIRSRLKDLLKAAQSQSGNNSFAVRSTDAPLGAARGVASPPPSETPAGTAPSAPSGASTAPVSPQPTEPFKRRVINAPVLAQPVSPDETGGDGRDGVSIKAQPQRDGTTCLFMVNQPVLPGKSWYFDGAHSAEGSLLVEKLFAVDDVDSVIVDDSTVTVSRALEGGDWTPLATAVGSAIRDVLVAGESPVNTDLVANIPNEEEIRSGVQQCIDDEVNPGVAAHSGYITLTRVRGNSVYIEMGGGCQGCSAADLTLKQGIHQAFRTAVPHIGAIYDETDHTAGINPYFS